MRIEIKDLLGADYATNPSQGQKLYDCLMTNTHEEITVSFKNIKLVSTAFLNRSIGKFAQSFPNIISKINFQYPSKDSIIELKVKDVIENVALGEVYDNLVDVADYAI